MKHSIFLLLSFATISAQAGQSAPAIEKNNVKKATPTTNEKKGTATVTLSNESKGIKVKVVNAAKVISEYEKGIEKREALLTKKDDLENQIKIEQKKFIDAVNDFQAKNSTLSDAAKEKEEKKLAQMERSLKEKAQDSKDELDNQVQKAMDELGKDFDSTMQAYAKEAKLDLVVDETSGRVVYAAEDLQCTNEIIALLNKQYKPNKKTAPAIKQVKA